MDAMHGLAFPVVDEGLGNSSYVVDLRDGHALVIDPSRDPAPYLQIAAERGLQISHIAETHLHADFISGGQELASRTGATLLAPEAARLEFPHRGVAPGEHLELGRFALHALATPGHTPEHLSYLLYDGSEPVALFSGGALIVGSAARTDLIRSDQTEPLARALYRAIQTSIAPLPDHVMLYPTHGAGSFCSASAGAERTSTIGIQRQENIAFRATDEDAFVKEFLGDLGSYPPYFLRLRARNQAGAVVGDPSPLHPLNLDAFQQAVKGGAEIIDARDNAAWAAAHIPGSISIELRPEFASWLGWLTEMDRPLAFILSEDQDRTLLIHQCRKIGYDMLAGELSGGMQTWTNAGLPIAHTPMIAIDDFNNHGTVLDVRQASEYVSGHIPGAISLELGSVADETDRLPSGPLSVMCGHGERATSAASLLERSGRTDVTILAGSAEHWSRSTGHALERAP